MSVPFYEPVNGQGSRIAPRRGSFAGPLLLLGSMVISLGMVACSSRQSAALASARSLFANDQNAVDILPLQHQYRYLRVTVQGKAVVMLVLGYMDEDAQGRPVEVWYSRDGEVLRLQNGRLIGLSGTPVEWANVRLVSAAPLMWTSSSRGVRFERHLDQMPGYHWAMVHHLLLQATHVPSSSNLARLRAQDLIWFEEIDERGLLPPARYALTSGANEPIYGEQCLDATFCLSWQRWPVTIAPSPK